MNKNKLHSKLDRYIIVLLPSLTPDLVGKHSVGYLRVNRTASDASIRSVSCTFDLNKSLMDEYGATLESMTLSRLHDGEWTDYDLVLVNRQPTRTPFGRVCPDFRCGARNQDTSDDIVDRDRLEPSIQHGPRDLPGCCQKRRATDRGCMQQRPDYVNRRLQCSSRREPPTTYANNRYLCLPFSASSAGW